MNTRRINLCCKKTYKKPIEINNTKLHNDMIHSKKIMEDSFYIQCKHDSDMRKLEAEAIGMDKMIYLNVKGNDYDKNNMFVSP
jgi:hypothetical protein